MADIELVIRISQESYNNLKIGCTQRVSDSEMIGAIKNSILLPKGHGRIGDLDALREEVSSWGMNDYEPSDFIDAIDSAPTVEAIPKSDYENRLKADLVAILTEIQLEIEELRLDRPLMSRGYECYGFEDKTPTEIKEECSDIIQQKINSLKEN